MRKLSLTLLKYKIYDICIDIAFDRFISNIILPERKPYSRFNFKVSDAIKELDFIVTQLYIIKRKHENSTDVD